MAITPFISSHMNDLKTSRTNFFTFPSELGLVELAYCSEDGAWVILANHIGQIFFIEMEFLVTAGPLDLGSPLPPASISMSPNNELVAFGMNDGHIKVVNLNTLQIVMDKRVTRFKAKSLKFDPTSTKIGFWDIEKFTLINVADGQLVHAATLYWSGKVFNSHDKTGCDLVFVPGSVTPMGEGTYIIATTEEGNIYYWNVDNGIQYYGMSVNQGLLGLHLNPAKTLALLVCTKDAVGVMDVKTGYVMKSLDISCTNMLNVGFVDEGFKVAHLDELKNTITVYDVNKEEAMYSYDIDTLSKYTLRANSALINPHQRCGLFYDNRQSGKDQIFLKVKF